jgi:hypothetical protein
MKDREKYRSEIESRLISLNENMEELTTKAKLRKDIKPHVDLEDLVKSHKTVKEKLEDLENRSGDEWQKARTEIDTLLNTIDADLRHAMAYFS